MERRIRTLSALLLLVVSSPVVLDGQAATGGINGTITDPAKAAVPGAIITLRNTATNLETTVNSNSTGFFTFVNVQPGTYTLSVSHSGFKAARLPEFTVGVNQTLTQDLTLTLGQVNETVTVESQAELIQQSSAELGSIVPQQAVQDL